MIFIKEYIIANWISILTIGMLTGYIVYLVITKQWERLRYIGFRLMLDAERIFDSGTGRLKFEHVFNQVYSLIPRWLSLIITEQDLRNALQEWYDMIKDYFDNGKIDNSINL